MEWLNYHHLLYFWVAAREGSIVRASSQLHVSQPTISGQIKALEEAVGEPVFARAGRRLVLTEMGRLIFDYCNEMFPIGQELMEAIKQRPTGRPLRLNVGVVDAFPKLVAHRLIEPALKLEGQPPIRVTVREDRLENLLVDLSAYRLDVILSDTPLGAGTKMKAFTHNLGECPVAWFGTPELTARVKPNFPKSLDGAPVILPTDNTSLRRSIDLWFDQHEVRPQVMGEFEDSASLKTFGATGLGVFPSPTIVQDTILKQYDVEFIGTLDEVRERFYAISADRKIKHPAVLTVCDTAREAIFGGSPIREP